MHLHCPHCRNPIEVIEDQPGAEIVCPSCGSTFRLEPGTTVGWRPTQDERRLGKFVLVDVVGVGAFGTVYMARDTELDRVVAIKVPRAGNLGTPEDLDRFKREARAAAQLEHPSIVSVHEVGESSGIPFLVTEFVHGATLADLLSTRTLSVGESAELIAEVADALDYAHRHGVVHRDVKPSNIMLQPGEPEASADGSAPGGATRGLTPPAHLVPRLMDFGLAKREADEITMTMDGQVLGTPAYMSPEQARGDTHKVDGRSDIYSLGVILYELLTGELPFRGTKRMLIHQVIHEEPRPPRRLNDHIARDLETICLKAMAKDASRRYPSARHLADDLRRWLKSEPIHARPVSRPERLWRWCKRNRTVASLLSVLAVLLISVAVGASFAAMRFHRLANRERLALGEANEARWQADAARERAEVLARKNRLDLYVSQIRLAFQSWENGDVRSALEQLEGQRPNSGEEDLRGFEWYYLWRLCHADRMTLDGHPGPVRAVAHSPSGKHVATASGNAVWLWDASTGGFLGSLTSSSDVCSCAFSPDGRTLAVGSGVARQRGEVKLWDVARLKESATISDFSAPVVAVAFSPNGTTLAAGTAELEQQVAPAGGAPERTPWTVKPGKSHEISLWDARNGRRVSTLKGAEGGVLALCFSPDGRTLASGSGNHIVRLWDLEKRAVRQVLHESIGPVWSVSFSRDGTRLAAGSGQWQGPGRIVIWELDPGEKRSANLQPVLSLGFALQGAPKPAARKLAISDGHAGAICAVAFAPDGDSLASGSSSGDCRIWNLLDEHAQLTERRRLLGHRGGVFSVAFAPDGKSLVSGSWDRTARIWYVDDWVETATLPQLEVGGGYMVAFSPNGKLFAAASESVKVFETSTGELRGSLPGHKSGTVLAFAPDGKTMATAGIDGSAAIWELPGLKIRHSLKGHTQRVWCVAYSADGGTLATSSTDGTVRLWDTASGESRAVFSLPGATMRWVAFSPDGRQLAAAANVHAGQWGFARIWDVADGQEVMTLSGHTHWVENVTFSADGKTLMTCSHDQTVKVWDLETGELRKTLQGHADTIYHMSLAPDNRTLATASWDGTVKLWQAQTGDLLTTLDVGRQTIQSVAFAHDSRALAAGCYLPSGRSVKLWYAARDDEVRSLSDRDLANPSGRPPVLHGALAPVRRFTYGFDGKSLIGVDAIAIVIQALNEDKPRTISTDHKGSLRCVAVGKDGITAATGGDDGSVKLWNLADGRLLASLESHQDKVYAVAFSPHGDVLASGSLDGTAILWDVASRRKLATLDGQAVALAFAPDGQRLAVGSWDKTCKIWDVATRKIQSTLTGHQWGITCVAWSHDGKWVAAGGGFNDPTIRVWHAQSGQLHAVLTGHSWELEDLEFAPDNHVLASACQDRTVKLWDVPRGTLIRTLTHPSAVLDVSFSTDGKVLASSSGGIHFWERFGLEKSPESAARGTRPRDLPAIRSRIPSTEVEALVKAGDWKQVLPIAERLTNSDPNDKQSWLLLGNAHFHLGNIEQAERAARRHLDLCPDCVWAMTRLARCYAARNAHDRAAELWDQLIRIKPDHATGLNNLAWLYATGPDAIRDKKRAVDLAQKAVELDPMNHAYWNTLGVAYFRAGEFHKAVETLERSGELGPEGPTAFDLLFLAMAHHQLGRAEKAQRFYEEAVRWMDRNQADDELTGFKAEAAAVLAKRGPMIQTPVVQQLGRRYEPKGALAFLNLQPKANWKLTRPEPPGSHENDLSELPRGEQTFAGVKFQIGERLIQLAGTLLNGVPTMVDGIPVEKRCARIYFLHATHWGGPGPDGSDPVPDGTLIARYLVRYQDDTTQAIPVIYGDDVRNWWTNDGGKTVRRGVVAWTGSNTEVGKLGIALRLFVGVWENPHPNKTIVSLDFESLKTTPAAPFCVAITIEEPQATK